MSRRKARCLGRERTCHPRWGRQPCHIPPVCLGQEPAIVVSLCGLGAAAQNIKISLRFISSPSRSFEIPAIRGRKLL